MAVVSVHFRDSEDEEYLDQEPYDFVSAGSDIVISPREDALYVEVVLESPTLREDGTRPPVYSLNLEVYACFKPGKVSSSEEVSCIMDL